jgi:hypothetical protein
MADKDPAVDRPWRVMVNDTFVDGYDNEQQATASMDSRNNRAAALGLTARYSVVKHV